MSDKKFRVKYIDLTTTRTVEETIPEREQYDLYKRQREGKINIISIHYVTEGMAQRSEPLLFPGLRKRLKERRETRRTHKEAPSSPKKSVQTNPESGRTFEGQSQEAYCLECIEGHSMKSSTEAGHAIDRFRTAGKMTEGVTEKVRSAIEALQGIPEDVKTTKDATPEVKKGLDEILDEVRWIRKDFGISGGLTRGIGNMEDLEELRSRILAIQNKAYVLVEKCPSCQPRARAMRKALEEKMRSGRE